MGLRAGPMGIQTLICPNYILSFTSQKTLSSLPPLSSCNSLLRLVVKLTHARFPLHVSHSSAHDFPFLGLFLFLLLGFGSNSFLFLFTVCFSSLAILRTVVLTVCVSECSVSLFSRYGRLGFALSFVVCWLYYCFIILKCLVCWCKPAYGSIEPFVTCWVFVHERTVVSTGFLTQASIPRLGEINRGSPKLLHASGRSGDSRCCWELEPLAWARASRLSETL